MAQIGILVAHLAAADAVSCDVLGMQRALAEQGHDVQVFAENWSPRLSSLGIQSYRSLPQFALSASLLIYHCAIGWNEGLELVRQCRCRRIIKFHNITPPEFFQNIHSDFHARCSLGQEEKKRLPNLAVDLFLSDSEFSSNELVSLGVSRDRSGILFPFHQVDRLLEVIPDSSLLSECDDGRVNVLSVGRIAPNKGHDALISAFAEYHHHYNIQSRLLIVGKLDQRLVAYTSRLFQLVDDLELGGAVVFLGEVTDEQLKACYSAADVFLTTSLHEGFCVPLVEAMAMRVPIVASASTAVPFTVGDAGLVWEAASSCQLAASIDTIVSDEDVGRTLAEFGWRRYQSTFTNERIKTELLQTIGSLI